MKIPAKLLKQNEEHFAPITVAEAVMVKHSTGVRRLDEVLRIKLEGVITPVGSGLTSSNTDNSVIISHSNSINPSVDELKPYIIKYDSRGHIIEAGQFGTLRASVNGIPYADYNGSSSVMLMLGDDFVSDNGQIQIRWNELD